MASKRDRCQYPQKSTLGAFRIARATTRSIWAPLQAAYAPRARAFLSEPRELRTTDMVVMPDRSAAHAREERLGVVRVDVTIQAVGFLMVDSVHREPAVKLVPCAGFVYRDHESDRSRDRKLRRCITFLYAQNA